MKDMVWTYNILLKCNTREEPLLTVNVKKNTFPFHVPIKEGVSIKPPNNRTNSTWQFLYAYCFITFSYTPLKKKQHKKHRTPRQKKNQTTQPQQQNHHRMCMVKYVLAIKFHLLQWLQSGSSVISLYRTNCFCLLWTIWVTTLWN